VRPRLSNDLCDILSGLAFDIEVEPKLPDGMSSRITLELVVTVTSSSFVFRAAFAVTELLQIFILLICDGGNLLKVYN
jgi:hypothetical protein